VASIDISLVRSPAYSVGTNRLSRGIGPGEELNLPARQESPATTLLVNGNVEGMRLVGGTGAEVKGRVAIEGKDPGEPCPLYIHFTDKKVAAQPLNLVPTVLFRPLCRSGVLDRDDKPVPGATVLLIAPLLFVWDDVDNDAWFDPGLIPTSSKLSRIKASPSA
jgi:hypothetical protein